MQAALIVLPVTAYTLLTLVFAQKAGSKSISAGLIKAHLVVFLFIAISTEALSAIQAITFPAILTAWLAFLLACSVFAGLRRYKIRQGLAVSVWRPTAPLEWVLVGALVFILVATLVTGFLYPPNTWDSMAYHMPRVVHWISNGSVAFYPTADVRQNYLAPLAEFAIMHFQILTGCDLYANMVQWTSFLVLICLGISVAAEFGLSRWQQLVSAVIVATIPMAILQASSTQNDLVVASFVMSFGLFMVRLRKTPDRESLILAAIALGLALLTKGTAYMYGAAVGISLSIPIVMASRCVRAELIRTMTGLTLIIIIALLLNTGHLWRNYHLYGHPLSTETDALHNEDMSASALLSNIVRNGALHIGTPSSRVRGYLDQAVQAILGSRLNDPKTTWAGASFKIPYTRHEDTAGNLIHVLVIMFSVVSLPIMWARRHCLHTRGYAIGIILAGILFCWLLKWQPWSSRLHTPLFAMAAPLMAVTITSGVSKVRKHVGHLIILLMILYSIRFVVANNSRDLESLRWVQKDRKELYFENRKTLFHGFDEAVRIVQGSTSKIVGLYSGGDGYEYPFWALANVAGKDTDPVVFRHVGVENLSATLGKESIIPAYVIATKKIQRWKHAAKYVSIYDSDYVSVYKSVD